MTDLSIIIVSYKSYSRLRQCLDALEQINRDNLKTEILVINNCPGDYEWRNLLKNYSTFQLVENSKNGGYGNGCNLGASIANGEFFLVLNPDTIVTEGALIKLVNFLRLNPTIKAVSCKQVNASGHESIAWGAFPAYNNLTGILRKLLSTGYKSQIKRKEGFSEHIFFPDWISGSAFLVRKDEYKNLNGFDEDFWMYYEDVDFCKRIRSAGGEIAFCTDATIEHNHGSSTRIDSKTASATKAEVMISKHIYINKHTTGYKKALLHTFMVINNLVSLLVEAVIGMIFFFVPKLFLRVRIFVNIIEYYVGCLLSGSWASPHSVNVSYKFLKR